MQQCSDYVCSSMRCGANLEELVFREAIIGSGLRNRSTFAAVLTLIFSVSIRATKFTFKMRRFD